MQKTILIMFGGVSPEHEVSVITGLQVIENIDRTIYSPLAIYVDKQGALHCLTDLKDRKGFLNAKRQSIQFGRDAQGGYAVISGWVSKKVYPYAAYCAFHGGIGESGPIQGMLEALQIPFSSTSQESAVLVMNKQLTKEQVSQAGLNVVPGLRILASEIKKDSQAQAQLITQRLVLPVIIKPVHLGSSIGIKIAKDEIELEKSLLEAAFIDGEILVEKLLTGFTEYNCAVRLVEGSLETSEIERPMSKDEILSFADKYQRGGKKTGGSGMASLQRELPAKMAPELRMRIQEAAKKAFVACRCKGMVRIDFMLDTDGTLYLTEINPIPGSMAFYLWEATGISFKQQISDLIEQAVKDAAQVSSQNLDYKSNIVESFVNQ